MDVKHIIASVVIVVTFLLCARADDTGNSRKTLGERDYRIFSAFLREQLAGKNSVDDIRVGQPGSVIAPETIPWIKPMTADERQWIKRELKGIQDDTLTSFEGCAALPVSFEARLSLPIEYHIASREDASSVERFYAKYPSGKTWGLLRLSCVGWNASETQVLFYLERTMCHCAIGKFVMMEKNSFGVWVTKGQMLRWIS